MNDDTELHGHYRGLLNDQLVKAATAGLDARWLARRMRTRAEQLLCEASTATGPARARQLRTAGNGLINRAEQLEALADYHRQASTTAEAALGRERWTITAEEGHPR